jgi:hypothetical protein
VSFALSVSGDYRYVRVGEDTFSAAVERHTIGGPS